MKIKKISMWLAIIGATLILSTAYPNFIRTWGKFLSLGNTSEAINNLTHDTNPYRTNTKLRVIDIQWNGDKYIGIPVVNTKGEIISLLAPIKINPPRCFYLTKSDKGFAFVRDMLQREYYKDFEKPIAIFIQYQAKHTEGDPLNPETTYRPIYAIPQEKTTEELCSQLMVANKAQRSKAMDELLNRKDKIYVSDEKLLTLALDSNYKTWILVWGTFFIVLSILLPLLKGFMRNKESLLTSIIFFFVVFLIFYVLRKLFEEANMETSIFIARIFGLCYLVVGACFVFRRKAFQRVMDDFCKNAALVFLGGMFALIIGVVIILKHNIWVANWTVIITIIGWLGLIKGIWIIAFPDSVPKFTEVYQRNKSLPIIHSIGALIFGAVLTFFGFFAR